MLSKTLLNISPLNAGRQLSATIPSFGLSGARVTTSFAFERPRVFYGMEMPPPRSDVFVSVRRGEKYEWTAMGERGPFEQVVIQQSRGSLGAVYALKWALLDIAGDGGKKDISGKDREVIELNTLDVVKGVMQPECFKGRDLHQEILKLDEERKAQGREDKRYLHFLYDALFLDGRGYNYRESYGEAKDGARHLGWDEHKWRGGDDIGEEYVRRNLAKESGGFTR